ncbi:MAG: Stf0 family sulfotransferase, partial [Gammaproteobacteria bacterium]
AEQLSAIEYYYGGAPATGIRAFGFKTKPSDVLDDAGLARLIDELGIRVLLLTRRNVVKQAVSLLRAIQLNESTGDWNLRLERDRVDRLTVDPERLIAWAEDFERGSEAVWRYESLVSTPTHRLTYEDLLTQRDETFRRIFEFLGVRPHAVSGTTLKHTADDLRDVIENFDEVDAALAGTPYQAMLHEVLA